MNYINDTISAAIENTIQGGVDADAWLQWYNIERPHSGKYCFGKTPMQTSLESKHLADEKDLDTLRPDALAAVG